MLEVKLRGRLGLGIVARMKGASNIRYGVLGLVLTLTAVCYLDRVCISTAATDIKADLDIDDAHWGLVFSAFTLAYALFEVPSGWLADRFGPRLMLTRIVVWWSLMTAATGLAKGFVSLLLLRALFGLGEAGTFPGIARVYARWLPERLHGRAFGLALMTAALGGAATQPLVVKLLKVMQWRMAFVVFGCVGVVWAVAWYAWFRDDPHDHRGVNEEELKLIGTNPPIRHAGVPWGSIFLNRNLFAMCAMYFGVIYGWYFYITWLPQYLQEARRFDKDTMGAVASWPLIGIAIGVALGGVLNDALSRRFGLRVGRRVLAFVGLPLASLSVVGATFTAEPRVSALLLAMAAGLAAAGVTPAWVVCLDIGGKHAGVVSGAMNTFGNLGGALMSMVVGFHLQRTHSWTAGLMSVAAFYLFALVCWCFIDPTKPIPEAVYSRGENKGL